jgi:hypothetical protein
MVQAIIAKPKEIKDQVHLVSNPFPTVWLEIIVLENNRK